LTIEVTAVGIVGKAPSQFYRVEELPVLIDATCMIMLLTVQAQGNFPFKCRNQSLFKKITLEFLRQGVHTLGILKPLGLNILGTKGGTDMKTA
jgi:hypothetical protein